MLAKIFHVLRTPSKDCTKHDVPNAKPSSNPRCLTLERAILQFRGELPSELLVNSNDIREKIDDLRHALRLLKKEGTEQTSNEVRK